MKDLSSNPYGTPHEDELVRGAPSFESEPTEVGARSLCSSLETVDPVGDFLAVARATSSKADVGSSDAFLGTLACERRADGSAERGVIEAKGDKGFRPDSRGHPSDAPERLRRGD